MGNDTNSETENQEPAEKVDQQQTENEDTGGAGSKQAVLADLQRERETRRSLQSQVEELSGFRESITKLLGGGEGTPDPAELANRLTGETSRAEAAEKLLKAVLAAPVGTNVASMVDSVSFREGAATAEDVTAFVAEWAKANAHVGAGPARDLNRGNTIEPSAKSFDDVIRGL